VSLDYNLISNFFLSFSVPPFCTAVSLVLHFPVSHFPAFDYFQYFVLHFSVLRLWSTRIGVILRGVPVPPFLDWGYRIPTFLDKGEEFAVNRGDMRRLNYTTTDFGRGSPLNPLLELTTLPISNSWTRGDTYPHFYVPFFLIWYPHFLDQSCTFVDPFTG